MRDIAGRGKVRLDRRWLDAALRGDDRPGLNPKTDTHPAISAFVE
jgi:hypothetical protein